MKNIHILPTPKPSRLIKNNRGYALITDEFTQSDLDYIEAKFQNIYITSDEEIKEGWKGYAYKEDVKGKVFKHYYTTNEWYKDAKKIILTTDQDLIKDGVQSIDDEFLQWFVKNPSCEGVEIDKYGYMPDEHYEYKIIIPKEEPKQYTSEELEGFEDFKKMVKPKQETPEQAAKNESEYLADYEDKEAYQKGFIDGVEWKAERRYSEEEQLNLLNKYNEYLFTFIDKDEVGIGVEKKDVIKWFEQFKKK